MALIEPTEIFGMRDPPEDEPKEQYLFLLELFVYRVTGQRLAKLNRMFFVPTRVCFKFLDFDDNDDIAVTPVDTMFEPQSGIADDVEHLNNGRSVMFAIARHLVSDKFMNFTIKLLVEKKMPENIQPDIVVGTGELDMTNHFAALRKEMLQCWHTNYPPPKMFEGNVELFYEDKPVGSVDIYVRISGFGQSIVTEIEAPPTEKKSSAYVFKSLEKDEKQLAYECRVIDTKTMNFCEHSNEDSGGKEGCPVCRPLSYTCLPCELKGAGGKVSQLSRTIEGNPRTRKESEPDDTEAAGLKAILCGKPFTVPWNPECSPGGTKSNEQLQKIREFREETKSRVLPIQSSRGPAEPCGKPVVLKISGLLDVEDPDGRRKQPTVTVAGQSDACNTDVDPDHDIFILRIGKKGLVGAGEKSDIQVEMRTPKGPERRPPIRYETREIQTEEETTKKASGKPGKGKNKKNKKK